LALFDFSKRRKERAKRPLNLDGVTDSPAVLPLLFRPASRRPTAPADDFPRFRSSASDQLEPSVQDRFAATRLKLRSAFTPAQPVVDRRMFAGRIDLLRALIDGIEDQRLHVVLYGDRGMGKTSTLHMLAQAAQEARYVVVYVPCSVSTDFNEFFRAVASEIPVLYLSNFGPTSPAGERGAMMAEVLPEGPVTVRVASEFCGRITGTRVLILLDEFDRTGSADFRRNVADFLKNLSDRSSRAQLVIAGVAANLTEIIAEIPSIQRNILAVEMRKMDPEELRELVSHGEQACGLVFDPKAVELIVAAADGFPYLASLLAQHAGLTALQDRRLVVRGGDVSDAIAEALSELKGRMSRRAQASVASLARDGAHKVLGRLAALVKLSNGTFSETDIDSVQPTPEAAARCRTVLEMLAADGKLVERFEDEFGRQYRFVESAVPQYLWLMMMQSRYNEGETPPTNVGGVRARS
jgi:Cdc6-like AAA superfamily ATPase